MNCRLINHRFALIAAVLTTSAALPAVASAATVSATLTGVGLNQIVSVKYNNADYAVYSGRLSWAAAPNDSLPTTFETFCIEFTQDVQFNHTYVYNVLSDIGQAPQPFVPPTGNGGGMETVNGLLTNRSKETLVRQLWAHSYSETHDGLSSTEGANSFSDSTESAAFQVAIWKILYESSQNVADQTSLSSGVFKLNAGGLVAAKAESYLDWLRDTQNASLANGLSALSNLTAQDQLYYDGTARLTMVPVPASVLSGGALLAALGAAKLVRSRRK